MEFFVSFSIIIRVLNSSILSDSLSGDSIGAYSSAIFKLPVRISASFFVLS